MFAYNTQVLLPRGLIYVFCFNRKLFTSWSDLTEGIEDTFSGPHVFFISGSKYEKFYDSGL